MIRYPRSQVLAALLMLAVAAGCSKKELPKKMKTVPADAEIVMTMDTQSILAYVKKTAPKLIPAGMKDKVPPFEKLNEMARDMIGFDLDKLGNLMFIGYAGDQDRLAFVVEGVDLKTLKGQKKGDHNGVAMYVMEKDIHYAELSGLGVVAGPSQEMLKKVLDTHTGKSKSIVDSGAADMFKELASVEKDLDQIRVYLLTGKLPGMGPAIFTVKGGGVFLDLDKGLAGTVVSDSDGASQMKTQLDQAMMFLQPAIAAGGDMGLPVKLDDETRKFVGDVLKKLKTDKSGNLVSVAYHGDLKPIMEKAVQAGMSSLAPEMPPSPSGAPSPTPSD